MTRFWVALAALMAMSPVGLAAGSSTNGASAPLAVSPIYAPNVRAAVVARGSTIYAKKAVTSVTHPSTGIYCIKPAATITSLGKSIVSVSIEWGNSSGSDLLAYWYQGHGSCPAGNMEVRTYDFAGGVTLSDDIAFMAVIP